MENHYRLISDELGENRWSEEERTSGFRRDNSQKAKSAYEINPNNFHQGLFTKQS